MRPIKDAIGRVSCDGRKRRRIERFYQMVCGEFPWLWAICPWWNLANEPTIPTVCGSKHPGLMEHLRADAIQSRREMWMVIRWGLAVSVVKVQPRAGASWVKAVYHTLATAYGSGCRLILYVVVAQVSVDNWPERFTIYRSPAVGWKWDIGKPLFGFSLRELIGPIS